MPPGLNPVHVLVVLVVALIVLGPQRLPDAARKVGRFMADFRRWSDSMQSEIRDALDFDGEPQPPPVAAAPPAPATPAETATPPERTEPSEAGESDPATPPAVVPPLGEQPTPHQQ